MIDNTNRYKQGKSYKPYIYRIIDIADVCNIQVQSLRNYLCRTKKSIKTIKDVIEVYKHFVNILVIGLLTMVLSGCYRYQVRQDSYIPSPTSQLQVYKDIINSPSMHEQELERQQLRDTIRDAIYGY